MLGRLLVSLWVPAILVPGALLMASHLVTLPKPATTDERMMASVARARPPEASDGFFALHVLLGPCNCSKRILSHLEARGPRRDIRERVLLIDASTEAHGKIRDAGFDVELLSREELSARYHVDAAPLLIVASPRGAIVYVGGYTDRKQSPAVKDVEIENRLLSGESVEPLPLFGCVVSRKLEKQIDPLGIR